MKQFTVRRVLGVAVLLGLVVTAFGQGMYWEAKMTGGPMGENLSKNYAMPKMFKHESDGSVVIMRLDKELFIMIDPGKKEYSEMTFDEMEKMMSKLGSKVDARMAQMQEQLKNLPPEQRKMIEERMGGKMPGMDAKEVKTAVKATGEKKTISGFACKKFVITEDGKDAMTMWTTKEIKEFEGLRKDWQEFSKRMMSLNRMTKNRGALDEMLKVDGFPIQTEMAMGIINTVTKIEKRATPASEFAVPAGYTKVKPKFMEEAEKEDN